MEPESDSDILWEQRFIELSQWQKLQGHCNVPKAEGKLGRWVVRQRELHKKSKLESERQRKLDTLGFVWNTNEAAWEHKYALLVKYKETHGHCCVPISDNVLGMWVAKMRANRRRNKLAQHRIEKLNAVSFIWNTAEADWKDKYNRLLHFRAVNGHSCVPFNEGELGWWVNTQRQNKRKGKLLPHRELLLNEASFIWAPQEFLAARRKQLAAERANNLSTEPLYRNQIAHFTKQHGQNYIHNSPISPPPGYGIRALKRRRPSYLDSSVLGAIPCKTSPVMHSPTSVKRFKSMDAFEGNQKAATCSPVAQTNSAPSNHDGQPDSTSSSHPPLIRGRLFHNDTSESKTGCAHVTTKELPLERQSAAALLSLATKQHCTASTRNATTVADRRGKMVTNYTCELGSRSVLSSICGVQSIKRHRVSPNSPYTKCSDFVLPPISSLRGFEHAKRQAKSETT